MPFADNPHNHSNKHQSSAQSRFWRNSISNPELLSLLNSPGTHHIGNLYRKSGIKINLGDSHSEEAKKIKSMMQFIKSNLGDSILLKIKAENDKLTGEGDSTNQGLALGQNQKQGNLSQEQHQKIMFFGMEFNKSLNPRSMTDPDLLEETYIKSIAVSILAETNGNSKVAESVLSNGGLMAIKQLDVKDLRNLLSDLQSDIHKDNTPQKE